MSPKSITVSLDMAKKPVKRTCKACGETKPIEQFYKRNSPAFPSKEYSHHCRECLKEKNKAHYWANRDKRAARAKQLREENPERHYAKKKEYYRKAREEVLKRYGGACTCCGETRLPFLAIDHIEGGGNKHRREAKYSNLFYWLRQNGYPSGFQVLCHNCNMAKAYHDICPHKL